MDGFSEAALEAEHGPPTRALLGLALCRLARKAGSKDLAICAAWKMGPFHSVIT